jgi:penicillin-binding protein 1C
LIANRTRSASDSGAFDDIKRDFRPSGTVILDRNGEFIQRVRTDTAVRRGRWTALADVSPALRAVLVQSEDKRLYGHSGIDWRPVSSEACANLWNSKIRGASTMRMRLAGLLDQGWRALANGGHHSAAARARNPKP